jgi:hypothetical protein
MSPDQRFLKPPKLEEIGSNEHDLLKRAMEIASIVNLPEGYVIGGVGCVSRILLTVYEIYKSRGHILPGQLFLVDSSQDIVALNKSILENEQKGIETLKKHFKFFGVSIEETVLNQFFQDLYARLLGETSEEGGTQKIEVQHLEEEITVDNVKDLLKQNAPKISIFDISNILGWMVSKAERESADLVWENFEQNIISFLNEESNSLRLYLLFSTLVSIYDDPFIDPRSPRANNGPSSYLLAEFKSLSSSDTGNLEQ